jgi:uncharacterized membrane protein YjjP (DUF1212 family)
MSKTKTTTSKDSQALDARSLTRSAFWLLVVAIYFITSSIFNNWDYSWIIFIVAIVADMIVEMKDKNYHPHILKPLNKFEIVYWLLIVVIYIIISFVFKNWDISWIIFVLATAFEKIYKATLLGKKASNNTPKKTK